MKKAILHGSAWLARRLPDGLKRAVYRSGPLARLLRSTLNRAAPAGLTEVEVAGGELAGLRLCLDLQTEKDYWLGTYELDLQHAVRSLVQPGWVAYDVGANLGYMSLLLARACGESGQVFAFEALPDNLQRLRQHVAMNGLEARIDIVAGAVAAVSGPLRFLLGPSGAMGKVEGSAGRSDVHQQAIEVLGTTLDDFIYRAGNPPPQVIKMDIEGGEVLALQGMPRILQEVQPILLVELHGPQAARVAWEVLVAGGYRICRMTRGFPQVFALDDLDWKAYLVAFPQADRRVSQ